MYLYLHIIINEVKKKPTKYKTHTILTPAQHTERHTQLKQLQHIPTNNQQEHNNTKYIFLIENSSVTLHPSPIKETLFPQYIQTLITILQQTTQKHNTQ